MKWHKSVNIWLFVGVIWIIFQIVIGGVTRLTESGLSITEWDVIQGTIPPLSGAEWLEAFELYKETPQYSKINVGMSLSEFKWIYFWEYFHRLWARLLGFVFLIPFVIFLIKGMLDRVVIRHLLSAVGMGFVVAIFGWIMVASGLVDRPWVNAYKLGLHLSLAIILLLFMLWISLSYYRRRKAIKLPVNGTFFLVLIALTFIQINFGAVLSGMKAAVFYPTWPSIGGEYIPNVLFQTENWNMEHVIAYDSHPFMAALIHFLHRNTAYILFILVSICFYSKRKVRLYIICYLTLILQVILGISTLLKSIGSVPVFFGAVHQLVGIIFLCLLFVIYWLRDK